MTKLNGHVVSVHAGKNDDLSKDASSSIRLELDGIVGDRHRSHSRLPKGSTLEFPSGAVLVVEEYNPPCHDMGKLLARECRTRSGDPLSGTAFSKAAKLMRGIVGVVDVPGMIDAGDAVEVEVYETPSWLRRSSD